MASIKAAVAFCVLGLASLCQGAVASSAHTNALQSSIPHVSNAQVDYARVRTRVALAYAEKAHEMSEAIEVLQGLSRETLEVVDAIKTHCGVKLEENAIGKRTSLRG